MYVSGWGLDFVVPLFEIQIKSKFSLMLESESFSSLMWELSQEILKYNTAKSCFITLTLLNLFKSY